MSEKVLISTRHGLGDAVQLTVVLKHLQKYRPDWEVSVASLIGKHSAYAGLCKHVFCCRGEGELNRTRDANRPHYNKVFDLPWHECNDAYADSPSTKAEYCLRNTFQIQPDPELWNYSIAVRPEVYAQAEKYLEHVCGGRPRRPDGRFPVLCIHYQGNTGPHLKNIEHREAQWICDQLYQDFGLFPLVMDWEKPLRTTLPIGNGTYFNASVDSPVWNGIGTGDAEMIAALVERSALMVGIDSGPLHVAAATTTPTIGLWKAHHPVNFLCPSSNVVNMLAPDHAKYIRGNKEQALKFFNQHYQYRLHQSFLVDVYGLAAELLSESERGTRMVYQRDHWIRSGNVQQDLCIVEDVYEKDSYQLAKVPVAREVVVDVGACLGSFCKLAHNRNPSALIIAVECCPDNFEVLKKNVAGFARIVEAACTYEKGEVALLNAVYPNCNSTGGSMLRAKAEVEEYATGPQKDRELVINGRKREYWADFRGIKKVTLEQLAQEHGFTHIDILKLDCEESEFSILYNCTMLSKIHWIVGEYHGRERFDKLVQDAGFNRPPWRLDILREGHFGMFRLENTRWRQD